MRRASAVALVWLAAVRAEAATGACSADVSAAALLAAPLQPPCCDAVPGGEDELLASGCGRDCAAAVPAWMVCLAVRRGWWRLARALLPRLADGGERDHLRQFAQSVKDGAARVVSLHQLGGSDDAAIVTPAVQWAQSRTAVHVLIRFSPKKHGPVSVSTVTSPSLQINASHVAFTAHGAPLARKPLHFELNLPLAGRIAAERSSHAYGTGRLTLTLPKADDPDTWAELCVAAEPGERRGHVTSWWEMAQSLQQQQSAQQQQAEGEGGKGREGDDSNGAELKGGAKADKPKPKKESPSPREARRRERNRWRKQLSALSTYFSSARGLAVLLSSLAIGIAITGCAARMIIRLVQSFVTEATPGATGSHSWATHGGSLRAERGPAASAAAVAAKRRRQALEHLHDE